MNFFFSFCIALRLFTEATTNLPQEPDVDVETDEEYREMMEAKSGKDVPFLACYIERSTCVTRRLPSSCC